MEHLYLAIDYGSSLIKVVFGDRLDENPHYFTMQPETIEVSTEAIEEYRSAFVADPARYCFIGVEGSYYAVGGLAQQVFRSTLNLAEPKSNYAVQRTLAAVAIAARLAGIDTAKKFRLFLSCVLPPGELRDRDILKEDLTIALQNFDTPTGKLRVSSWYFNCHPEGGGLSLFYERYRGDLGDRSLGVVMMGHRNASCFTVRHHMSQEFRSSNLGFATVVSDIQALTSAYSEKDLTNAVARYLLGKEEDKEPLTKILLRNTQQAREQELDKLLKAISISKLKFWNAFAQWLAMQLPQIDEILFGGGVAKIFEREMADYFKDKLPNLPEKTYPGVYLQGGLKYPEKTLIPIELQARFADIQCLWEHDILPNAKSYWQNKKEKNKEN